jgi:hypothetical protein
MEKLSTRFHFPLIALGMLALLTAMWAGLVRLGWNWPVLQPTLPISHGPLMVSGFLGTVIGLERAVALSTSLTTQQSHRWTYLGPLLTGLGALALIIGLPGFIGPVLLTLGSLNLVVVFGLILRIQLAPFTLTMAVGALLWLIGNSLWLLGWPIHTLVSWWSGFLILTIAGERLELGRILRLSGLVQGVFEAIMGLFLAGLVLALFHLDGGTRLTGAAMAALALWLLRYDVARYTVRKSGLTRFMAICLLAGYGWLGLSGLLSLYFGSVAAGFHYDAIQHAVFVGFVISMIFAHAPIIFPAITGKAIPFSSTFYAHLALLHLSLLLRVTGDLIVWLPGRQWGGLLNVAAILLFMLNTLLAVRRGGKISIPPKIALQSANPGSK